MKVRNSYEIITMSYLTTEIGQSLISEINIKTNVCRACLSHDKNLRYLFSAQDKNTFSSENVLKMFNSCTNSEASVNDKYPKHICNICFEQLIQAYNFWQKCKSSISRFDKFAKKLDVFNDIQKQDVVVVDDKTSNIESEPDFNCFLQFQKSINNSTTDEQQCKFEKITCSIEQNANLINIIPSVRKTSNQLVVKSTVLPDNIEQSNLTQKQETSSGENHSKNVCSKLQDVPDETEKLKNAEYNCRKCKLDFTNHEEYLEHTHNHRLYLCPECGHLSKSLSGFREHAKSHSSIQPYECKLCGKKYKSHSSLLVHMHHHSDEKNYICEHCGQKFVTWSRRFSHIRTYHSTERPHVCDICSKTFKQSGTLKVHKRLHTGEKPYPCSECTMAFKSSSDRNAHMVRHTGERKYLCSICEKRFTKSYSLKQHMVTHTGERKHKCEVCRKAFTQAHVLKGHMKTHLSHQSN